MIILGWILGILLVVVGLIGSFFNRQFNPLHKAEVELMKRDGKFEEEPDYMQNFRVSRAEGELMDNERRFIIYRRLLFVGVTIILVLLGYHLWGWLFN